MNSAHLEDVKLMIRDRRPEDAERTLTNIHREQRGSPESYYLLGSIHSQKNRIAEAVESFQHALRIDPGFVDAAISLSVVFNDIGDYKEGRRYFQMADQLARSRLKIQGAGLIQAGELSRKHLELGNHYRKLQAWDDAANEYAKAVRLDPHNHEARIFLAKALAQKGLFQDASRELRGLIAENPSHIPARVHLALLYQAFGNTVDAQIELNEALRHDPNNEQVKTYLAMTREVRESTISN